MDEENDISAYQPTWRAAPLPFQGDDPVAPVQIHGIADDASLDPYTDAALDPTLDDDGGLALLGLMPSL